MKFLIKKVFQKKIFSRILVERLSEPLHLNFISIFVWLFGSLDKKIKYDLILRPHHAFSLYNAALKAKQKGLENITVIEFGVASGAGLMNIVEITNRIEKEIGVHFKIYGFDTGKGMPKPQSYKDHPEYYLEGDFPMNFELLKSNLPDNVTLIIGNVKNTVNSFLERDFKEEPIAFVSFDLDYYSSTIEAFNLLKSNNAENYMSLCYLYFDDISLPNHNSYCGELLAINEFNDANDKRKIEYNVFLPFERIFRKTKWIRQVYYFHVLDHSDRSIIDKKGNKTKTLQNPYLSFKNNKDQLK